MATMDMHILLCVCGFLIWHHSATDGANHDDAVRLLRDIKSTYNGDIRPVVNQSDAVNITMVMYVVDILEFDELLETLKTSAVISLQWFDQGTHWKPEEYGGLTTITLRNFNFLWTPAIALTNTAEQMANIFEDKECAVILLNNGQITVSPAVLLHSSCKVDITYYPFDTQTCGFIFYPFGFNVNDIEFDTENSNIGMVYFTHSGAWKLVNTNTKLYKTYLYFEIMLQRKPQYVILNIIIPIIAFSMFNLFVFCIPVESGERISYCLTVLLSLAVFLTLVGQTLPKTSEPMSWFSFSLVGTVLTSIGINIAVIFNMRLYYKDESTEVGRFWTRFMYCLSKRKSSEKRNRYTKDQENHYVQHGDNDNIKTESASFGCCSNVNMIYSSYPHDRNVELQTSCQENRSVAYDDNIETYNTHTSLEVKVTWKEVTNSIDKIGFIFFLSILLCNYIVFALKCIYRF